jgi:hypothetical protein
MRYLLAGLTVVIAALAVGALVRSGAGEPASVGASVPLPQETPAALLDLRPVPTLARVRVPYTTLPEQAAARPQASWGRSSPSLSKPG